MSAHHFLVAPLTSAAGSVADQAAVTPLTMTSGRAWSTIAIVVGVAAVGVGVLALVRGLGIGHGRRRAIAAIAAVAAGMAVAIIGGAVVANAEGGPGTGYGIVGGYVALAVGLIAILLGGLALARSRPARA